MIEFENGNNVICDDEIKISYCQFRAEIMRLRNYIYECEVDLSGCFYFEARNDILSAIIILLFLEEKINFYIASPNKFLVQVPAFCDVIISRKGKFNISSEPKEYLEFTTNHRATGQIREFEQAEGLVFVASSGTSGTPKFICFKGHKLLKNAMKCADRFQLNSSSKLLVPVPISHMYGLGVGLLTGILSNSNLYLIDNNNVIKLYDRINYFNPDVSLLTATVCRMMLALNKPLRYTNLFIAAGERIHKDTFQRFEATFGTLINLYGCSELGAIATSPQNLSVNERISGDVIPLDGVKIRMAEHNSEIQCFHDCGFEFYIDEFGNRVYLDSMTGINWFGTKDKGAVGSNNSFRILGRVNNSTNRFGFIILFDEVESMLMDNLTEIDQVVVFEKSEANLDQVCLVAVYSLKQLYQLDERDAINRCRKAMLKHFIPDRLIYRDELPKLLNGKLNRAAIIKSLTEE